MLKFSVKNPVYTDEGLHCTFKRCTSSSFSNWYINNEKLSDIPLEFEHSDDLKKDILKTDSLSNKELFLVKNTHINFMSDRILKVEGLKDDETGDEITVEVLSKNRETLTDFINMLFEDSEGFQGFFEKYKDGAEKKSD